MVYKDKVCEHCKTSYMPKSGRSSFCSPECTYKAKRIKLLKWREDNPEIYKNACNKYNENRDKKTIDNGGRVLKFEKISCKVCNTEFVPLSPVTKYCSKKCRIYVENELKKIDRSNNPEKYRVNDKKHYYSDFEHTRKLRNKNSKIRRENNISVKIANNLRSRLREAVKGHKQTSVMNLIGCDIDTLLLHIESLFINGMSWDNYGVNGWHIDHIKPCIAFDLESINEQKKCFNYSNLQPLWALDNLSKGGKYNEN